jgi:flagellar biosynthesis protein FlhA
VLLTEYVRQAIRRTVVKPYLDPKGELPAFMLDPKTEQAIESSVQHTEQNSVMALSPQMARDIALRLERKLDKPEMQAPVLVSAGARPFLRQMIENSFSNIAFISHNEIPAGVKVISLGVL